MTDSALTASPDGVRLEHTPKSPAMFIDWPVNEPEYATCSLLDGIDFSTSKLVFFDPLRFAIATRLMSPDDEISDMNYISLDEKDFLRYLAGTKTASETISRHLENGGLFIIRSNIPKLHIKVRKKSSAGTRKYTESVISAFFWLEDILGVYSLTYCQAKTLKYVSQKSPLVEVFGKSGIHCVQTLNAVSKARLEVVATGGSSTKVAAISKLSFEGITGRVFLVPQFLVRGETQKLVDAFGKIAVATKSGSLRPRWLDYYEKQVRDFSPFRPMIDNVELEMEALKKQMASLMRKQDVCDGLVELLYETGEELEVATRTAMEILGFTCLRPPSWGKAPAFEVHATNDKSVRIMVRAVHTETGPLPADEVATLVQAIEGRTSALKAKGMLVSNASRYGRPEQRQAWFDEPATDESKRLNICLMPSLVLFTAACYVMTRNDADNIDTLKRSLRRDILECDSVFVLSRKKYAI